MPRPEIDFRYLQQALELAERGRGLVEPNPLVGCVVVSGGKVVGNGWHQQFGGPHAEVAALAAAGSQARGADVYVTLEPCCHQGKTPPCTQALLAAEVARVIVGCRDPNPQVSGQGIAELAAHGVEVIEPESSAAAALIAPFTKLVTRQEPWVIAKWAMSLDGKIATHTGNSQWISSAESRAVVHRLRGRVDAVLVGRGTVEADDPLLTARPPGPRIATRIVLDSLAKLSLTSQLLQTARTTPLLVVVSEAASAAARQQLEAAGAEVWVATGDDRQQRLVALLKELGRRDMTNLLVEGGGELLGSLLDLQTIDEVHVFIAPTLVGGAGASSPLAGEGIASMAEALRLESPRIVEVAGDVYIQGRVSKS